MNAMSPRRLTTLAVALALAALLAQGCSVSLPASKPRAERHYYVVDPARPQSPALPAPFGPKSVLKVRQFTVSPGFASRELAYKVGPNQFETDYYNLLFMQPGPALTQTARAWLEASHLFGNVVESTSQAEETHALEGNLVSLYGDYTQSGSPKAVAEVQFFLLTQGKTGTVVAFQKSYHQEISLNAGNAADLADGLQKALGAILAACEADLRALPQK